MNIQTLILAFCTVYASMVVFDFIVYAVKAAPKTAIMTKLMWRIGFVCLVAIAYYIFNGEKFW